jgi:hypothetical protein
VEPPPEASSKLGGLGSAGLFDFDIHFEQSPPATGELFEVVTIVRHAHTGEPVDDARFTLDATMPEHGHGMTTRPEHTALGEGRYLSRGMKLHMPGRWLLRARAELPGQSDELSVYFNQPHLSR